jgi:hypothetical protein
MYTHISTQTRFSKIMFTKLSPGPLAQLTFISLKFELVFLERQWTCGNITLIYLQVHGI